jgi:ATP-binding cassette subfamily G (WHITE) protein 2 (SNQ2)
VLNPFNIIEFVQKARHPPIRDIINGFEGVVKPGEMLRELLCTIVAYNSLFNFSVILGRPGSGCSTFLKALSNKRDEFRWVHGEVHYDALLPEEVTKHFRGDVTYCAEDDIHFPTLTVSQTIRFAARVRAPSNRLGSTRIEYANHATELLMTLFGLQHAKDTPIGDAIVHGISGGEKRRVSICEALATRTCLTAWDK